MQNKKNVLTLLVDLDYQSLSKSELYEFLKITYSFFYQVKRASTSSNIFKNVTINYLDPNDGILKDSKIRG